MQTSSTTDYLQLSISDVLVFIKYVGLSKFNELLKTEQLKNYVGKEVGYWYQLHVDIPKESK